VTTVGGLGSCARPRYGTRDAPRFASRQSLTSLAVYAEAFANPWQKRSIGKPRSLKIEPTRCSIAISGNQGDEGRQQRRRLQRSAQRDPCRRDNTSGKARAERGGRSLSRPAKRGPGGASTGAGAFKGVLAVFCAAATLLPWSLPAAPSAHWAIGPANNSPSCSAGAVNEISLPSDCARFLVSQCSVRAPRGRTRPRHHGRPHVEAWVCERTLRGAAADQAVILTLLGLRVRGGRAVRACHRSYPGLFSPSLLPLFAPFVSDVFLCLTFRQWR
jgi:hypothetical protein